MHIKKTGINYFFIVLICFCSCICTGCRDSVSILKEESIQGTSTDNEESQQETDDDNQQILDDSSIDKEQEELESIYVDVAGAIADPGVYKLPEGSRVFQAIEAAGGCTQEADTSLINLAEILQDGQKIYVYSKQEAEKVENDSVFDSDGKVNINQATKEDLMNLPGIGETRAEAILSYRQTNGSFSSIEELMNVEGIKTKTYEKLKDKITAY